MIFCREDKTTTLLNTEMSIKGLGTEINIRNKTWFLVCTCSVNKSKIRISQVKSENSNFECHLFKAVAHEST